MNQALDCDLWDLHSGPCSVIESLSCWPKFFQVECHNAHFETCALSFHGYNVQSHHLPAYTRHRGAGKGGDNHQHLNLTLIGLGWLTASGNILPLPTVSVWKRNACSFSSKREYSGQKTIHMSYPVSASFLLSSLQKKEMVLVHFGSCPKCSSPHPPPSAFQNVPNLMLQSLAKQDSQLLLLKKYSHL